MAVDDEQDDKPAHSEVFSFGKSRLSDGQVGRFWIKNDPVLQVACGDEHTSFLTATGRVFTFGSNEWGQLGQGNTSPLDKPTLVKGLQEERATVLVCGRSHTLVATDKGNLYGFGCNSDHQLGSGGGETSCQVPTLVQGLLGVNIKMLAAGAEHSLALTDKDVVFAWGGNGEGQLGLGDRHSVPSPTELKLDSSAICIASGYYHSAIITMDGKLLTFGESDGGKLGLTENVFKKSNRPQPVAGIAEKLIWVGCGGQHTVVISVDGKVYSFGDGSCGQLGLGPEKLDSRHPQPVKSLEGIRVARVACGESHTAFLAEGGFLYTCGDGRHAKLALSDDLSTSNQFLPHLVTFFQEMTVQQVSCGGCHTVVLAEKSSNTGVLSDTESPSKGSLGARARRRQRNLPPLLLNPEQNGNTPGFNLNKKLLPTIGSDTGDDEVVCESNIKKMQKRRSLLQQAEEDTTIRHADSDVESDVTSNSEMNSPSETLEHEPGLLRPARLASGELLSPLIPADEDPELLTSQGDVFSNSASEKTADAPDSSSESPKKACDGTPNKTPSRLSRLFKFQRRKSLTRQEKSQSEFYDDEVQAIQNHEFETVQDINNIEVIKQGESPKKKLEKRRKSDSKLTPQKTALTENKVVSREGRNRPTFIPLSTQEHQ